MNTVTIEVGPWVEPLVDAELLSQYYNLVEDYKRIKEGVGYGIFHTDKQKDLKALKKHIKAFKVVLDYNDVVYKE